MVMWNLVGYGAKWAARGIDAFSKTETGKKTAELSGKAYRATRDAAKDAINTYKENQADENNTAGDVNLDEWFHDFAYEMQSEYQDHIDAIRTAGARTIASAMRSPVLHSRQALLDAYKQNEVGSIAGARGLLSTAIISADSGAVTPDAAEWPIDGPEVGRGHACMWGAIARVLAHKQGRSFAHKDATLSDSWFGAAFVIFMQTNEVVMAGRALQEWAESRRLCGDEDGANVLFLAATCAFSLCGNQHRLNLVSVRSSQRGPVAMDSSFFLNRPATEQESRVLSSVLGARNAHRFYGSLA